MRTIIFLALLGFALATTTHETRIVGGTDASIENYPFMSNMQYGWAGVAWAQNCGGTLITNNAVLSAAHCYHGYLPAQWRVVLGTASRTTGGTTFNVATFTIHPSYNVLSTLDADVAIVHLATNAVFSQTINRAVIASAASVVFPGLPVTTIGWGDTKYGGQRSEQLQQVDISIVNQQICAQRYAFLKTQPGFASWPDVTPGMACAGVFNVGGKDACMGDSGGPVIFIGTTNIVVGINSWSYRCAEPLYPSVLVRVPTYTNWIMANA